MIFKQTLFVAAAGAAVLVAGCGGGSASGSSGVATFNGAGVTRDDYVKRLETLQVVRVRLANGQIATAQLAEPMSSQALQNLMIEQAVLQAARDEKVLPTKEEIERHKKLQEDLSPGWTNELKKMGLSIDDIDRQLLLQLANEKLLTRGVKEKTLADVEKYIKDNPEVSKVPATATFRWILVNTAADRAAVDRELAAGQPFGAVASKYSKAPNARLNNGSFPDTGAQPSAVPVNRLDKLMQDAVGATTEGKRSQWITEGNESVLLFIEAKSAETVRQLSASQKEVLRREMMKREGASQNDVEKTVLDKLLKANVKVNVAYLRQYWDAYKKQLQDNSAKILNPSGEVPPTPGETPKDAGATTKSGGN
jgi:parvulin-like peptidyl-prolyl isomerase